MALEKQEDWNLGGAQPTQNYHRVCDIRLDPKGNVVHALVASWYNKAARDAGDTPYNKRAFDLLLSDHPELAKVINNKGGLGAATDLSAEMYVAIKAVTDQHSGFFNSGTTDV